MAKKSRLDSVLVARGLFPSREQAQRAIMAGEVRVGTRVASKSSELLANAAPVAVAAAPRFVGRGWLKLEGALDFFHVDVREKIALDGGASTGGFTDCLLQRGAAKVYAIDVGTNQLAWKLRTDPRVISMEKTNIRDVTCAQVPEPIDLIVCDASFIGLRTALPAAPGPAAHGARLLARDT